MKKVDVPTIIERFEAHTTINYFHLIRELNENEISFILKNPLNITGHLENQFIKAICQYKELSLNFIELHKDKLDWELLSEYQKYETLFQVSCLEKVNLYLVTHRISINKLNFMNFIERLKVINPEIHKISGYPWNIPKRYLERKFLVLRNKEWKEIPLKKLKDKDMFQVFEKDGTQVSSDGIIEFQAMGNPYINNEGLWTIKLRSPCIEFNLLEP